eukprot:scaffold7830_cov376-Prasinococcus_capsulatus_cf.AAC.4
MPDRVLLARRVQGRVEPQAVAEVCRHHGQALPESDLRHPWQPAPPRQRCHLAQDAAGGPSRHRCWTRDPRATAWGAWPQDTRTTAALVLASLRDYLSIGSASAVPRGLVAFVPWAPSPAASWRA